MGEPMSEAEDSVASPRADPRLRLGAALDQVQRQIDAVSPADLGRPTPCSEFDVDTLLAHLVAVVRKVALVGAGGDMREVADPAAERPADWATSLRQARGDIDREWAPDARLEARYGLPWGPMTGRAFLNAYAHEFTVHAWDLAAVTGRHEDLDPDLAEAALSWYVRNVPADARPAGGPFGPAVPVDAGADAYTRLAGFVGRAV